MLTRRSWWMVVAMLGRLGTARAEPVVMLTVDIASLRALPERQRAALIAETAAIWRPYGVALEWSGVPVAATGHATVLTVVPDRERGRAGGVAGERLGGVEFRAHALVAQTVIHVNVAGVRRSVMAGRVHGRPVREWPEALADDLIGRALGRVLAHEIGHYLIAWRGHTADGLMRAEFSPDVLVAAPGGALEVPPLLLPRLRARLSELARPSTTTVARAGDVP